MEKELRQYFEQCRIDFHEYLHKEGYLCHGISDDQGLRELGEKIVDGLINNDFVYNDVGCNMHTFSGVVICRAIQCGMITTYWKMTSPRKVKNEKRIDTIIHGPEEESDAIYPELLGIGGKGFYLSLCQGIDDIWQSYADDLEDEDEIREYLSAAALAAFQAGSSLVRDKLGIKKKLFSDQYSIKYVNDKFLIMDGDEALKTPAGKDVTTLYFEIADRIHRDLNRFGYVYTSIDSILSWHFTIIDNFAPMGAEKVRETLDDCFLQGKDWTIHSGISNSAWIELFGDSDARYDEINEWLKQCTIMQMTAACCIGNAYESLNVAYVLAKIMEQYSDYDRHKYFEKIANIIAPIMGSTVEQLISDFVTFELYYGIHLKEKGNIILEEEEEDTEDYEDLNLVGSAISDEILVGRNFYHYTDGIKDKCQPLEYKIQDFELDLEDEEDEDEEPDDGEELLEYMPDDCWVKRYVDDNDLSLTYLFYIVVKDGKIAETGFFSDRLVQQSFGGFIITNMPMPVAHYYEDIDRLPDKVKDDLEHLNSNGAMPLDYSFIGKPIPEGLSEYNEEESYAKQSAHRLAYMWMGIEVDDDNNIESLEYSTYQSSGTGDDSFMRPVGLGDMREEAIDMLLYMYDRR